MTVSLSRKSLFAGMLAMATVSGSLALSTTQASAWCRGYGCDNGGAVAAGVVGGMALGALAGAAAAGAPPVPVYGPPPAPVYVDEGPECYMAMRRVWVEGLGWRRRSVEVCD